MPSHPPPRLAPDWVRRVQRLIGAQPTGQFDDASVRKLKLWQAKIGLPATGELDHTTWTALHDHLKAKETPIPLDRPKQGGEPTIE